MDFADYRGKEPEVKIVDFKDNTSGDYHYNMIRLDETIPWNIFKGNILPSDFMERITDIFMYQMERKNSHNIKWKIVHRLLGKLV